MIRVTTNIAATIVGGLIVVGIMSIFMSLDWASITFAFIGAAIGSLTVDLFHWFGARRFHWFRARVSNELHEDVVQVIDTIFERNMHNYQETGYIRARGWKVPLTPEQIIEMNKVLYVENS